MPLKQGLKREERNLSPRTPVLIHKREFQKDCLVGLHYHSSLEINLCRNTTGTVYIDGSQWSLQEAACIILPPGKIHSYKIIRNTGQIDVIHIGLEFFPMLNNSYIREVLNSASFLILREDESPGTEVIHDILSDDEMIRAAGVLTLIQKLIFRTSDAGAAETEYKTDHFLRKIISWSEDNYSRPLTLSEAAEAVNLSLYHFSRKFRSHSGFSYMEYLNQLRLENSLRLLEAGLPVSETAEKSGFSDSSYFIRKFKNSYKVTPLQYQKSLLKETRPVP
ncbi:MAG: AraC family transcriptional regulator [Spirochaetales bacterium]|nr:AraC family transcriptional regulator [Spirochaetales bacterium]